MTDTSIRISKYLKAHIDRAKLKAGFSERETSQFFRWMLDSLPAVDVLTLQRRVDELENRISRLESYTQNPQPPAGSPSG